MRLLLLIAFGTLAARAHDPITTRLTWSKEISRIVYKRCGGCHQNGGSSMPLITYADARPWAKAIRDEVLSRRMPPWGAIRGFRDLRHDPSLTQEEIIRIAEWVEGGAPEGDAKYVPEPPPPARASPVPARASAVLAAVLQRPLLLAGLEPATDVADAKITAVLPGGRVEPLLWLHGYKAKWKRSFVFAEPIALPSGTRITIPAGVTVRGIAAAAAQPREVGSAIATPQPAH